MAATSRRWSISTARSALAWAWQRELRRQRGFPSRLSERTRSCDHRRTHPISQRLHPSPRKRLSRDAGSQRFARQGASHRVWCFAASGEYSVRTFTTASLSLAYDELRACANLGSAEKGG